MRLRVEMGFGLGAVMGLQILTAVGAVGLLSRVTPAVEEILRDNVPTLAAIEDMLHALLDEQGDGPAQFHEALRSAQRHLTEPQEAPLLDDLEVRWRDAFRDPDARQEVQTHLRDLAEVNRATMHQRDEDARFLGTAGAWSMVGLGSFGFALGLIVHRRLRERIELPVRQLDATLAAARRGDEHRRCHLDHAPLELIRSADNINSLLARIFERPQVSPTPEPDDRAVALHLMDLIDDPLVIVGVDGRLISMNKAAMRAGWDEDPQIARRLADAVATDALLPEQWSATAIPNSSLVLCRRCPTCGADPTPAPEA